MTNHVTTRCTIRGSSADVAAFRALMVEDPPPPAAPAAGFLARLRALLGRPAPEPRPAPPLSTFDFNRILPMPGTLADGPAQAAWALEHWGTQRNAEHYFDETARHDDGVGSLDFFLSTAWSFPAPVFEALHRRFPALRIDVVGFEEAWHFAVEGAYGPGETGAFEVEPTAELYTRVYGEPPEPDAEG